MAKNKQKLRLKNFQSPGDICMMAYALKALHECYPDRFLTDVETSCDEIFEGNPYVTKLDKNDASVKIVNCDYPAIHQSNEKPHHFVNAFARDLEVKLSKYSIRLEPPPDWSGTIYITEEEKGWFSQVYEILGYDPPMWIIDAGWKRDYTLKQWDVARWQEIVSRFPDIWFVQIGHKEHIHPTLMGNNVINLVGKTDLRQLIRLVWHSFGVITPISLPMHLAYAIPPHPRFDRKSRACIVIAGGREPNHWQAAANQQFVHTCGMLPCCDHGGCWLSRAEKINDGDKKDEELCHMPVKLPSGQVIGKCMDMISADEVCLLIGKWMDNLEYKPKKPSPDFIPNINEPDAPEELKLPETGEPEPEIHEYRQEILNLKSNPENPDKLIEYRHFLGPQLLECSFEPETVTELKPVSEEQPESEEVEPEPEPKLALIEPEVILEPEPEIKGPLGVYIKRSRQHKLDKPIIETL